MAFFEDHEPRTYTQHDRELLLMAWMDIESDHLKDVILNLDDDILDALEDEPISEYIKQIINPSPNPQLMWQAVASTSDAHLHGFVQAFGKDPLGGGES